jgi:hypothetical protein
MVKTKIKRPARGSKAPERTVVVPPQPELWETLEAPVEVAEAIRKLSELRQRFERALEMGRAAT